MSGIGWEKIHDEGESWRAKLVGELSQAFIIPRYLQVFEQFLNSETPATFLELGSGNGDIAARIQQKKFDFIDEYTVSESFPEGVAWLKKKGLNAVRADAQHIPFPDQSFDVVVCFDVMHHVENPRLMAREMMRVGKGRLFLTESNGLSLGRKLLELTPAHRRAGERSYSPWKYRSFFQQKGYQVQKIVICPFVFPLKVLPKSWVSFEVAFNRWIEHVPLLRWQCSNVYIYVEYERTVA